mmetsp:Transcript_13512/g.34324  ORF Transcript_13512/g.34324 Transcript_13512/m.34324 type:complete len:168 (-) Transcript_13512:287-790(-)
MGLVSVQAAVQGAIRPGTWLPGVRNFHSEVQEWTISVPVVEAMEKVWAAAEELRDAGYSPRKLDKENKVVVIDFFTAKAKWLDQVVLRFSSLGSGCKCVATNSSTGVFPLVIPLAPVLNVALCWFPFGDGGKCANTLDRLCRRLGVATGTEVTSKTLRFSITNPKKK